MDVILSKAKKALIYQDSKESKMSLELIIQLIVIALEMYLQCQKNPEKVLDRMKKPTTLDNIRFKFKVARKMRYLVSGEEIKALQLVAAGCSLNDVQDMVKEIKSSDEVDFFDPKFDNLV